MSHQTPATPQHTPPFASSAFWTGLKWHTARKWNEERPPNLEAGILEATAVRSCGPALHQTTLLCE